MLEARKFTHISATALAMRIALALSCMFTFSALAVHAAGISTLPTQANAPLRLKAENTIFTAYPSLFDPVFYGRDTAMVDPVSVSLPDMFTLVGSNFTIPVTVGDTTGKGIRSFQFDLLYDPDAITPQPTPIDTVGTISEGMGVSVNNSVPGVLRVVFFSSSARTGQGTLFKFKFSAVGAEGTQSGLDWQDFMFNEGDPAASMTNGSVLVVTDHTITVTQSANGTIDPGTSIVPYGQNKAFIITPAPNHHIVDVIVDGASVGQGGTYTFNNVTADHTLTATFAIDTFQITASAGANGTVTPAGVTNVPFNGSQTYTITPSANYLIDDVLVDGASVGAVTTHTFSNVTAPHTISATFKIKQFKLTVTKGGNGTGTVTSAPAGVNCGADCEEIYNINTSVTLTATPAVGTLFSGWSGACTGTDTCIVTMDAAKSVTATFTLQTFSLSVNKAGNGSGTVTSAPVGIDCGSDCTETYDHGTTVTLTAAAATGSNFTGWSGACTGSGTCIVTVDGIKSVTATFTLQTFALNVSKTGTGTGTVTSVPAGIDCGADCTETYNYGTSVTLTAAPSVSSLFTGWSGACTGTGTCTVTMDAVKAVTATFNIKTYNLDVVKAGNGGGTVSSSPAGIDCGSDCAETYNHGNTVILTATPNANSNFTGWSGGGCSGTNTCVVTVTATTTVTATFTLKTFALNVSKTGTGAGTVTSAPTGIDCGTTCSKSFDINTSVTLTATPATGSTFGGWSGACTGTGTCVVTMDAAKSVTATFTIQTFTLTVAKAGNGSGTVTSAPGIDCGADCSEPYTYGTVVILTASPNTGSNFTGWSGGGCTGTGNCVVTISAATTVTATFSLQTFSLTVQRIGSGAGYVSSSPAGIDCSSDCFDVYNYGTVVTLTATPNVDSTFTGWSGGGVSCPGTGTCAVTMTADRTVMASFTVKTFQLTTVLAGNGGGAITSAPAGVNCGADCTESYNFATQVTLTATPFSNSDFAGWSGACSGTGSCVVTMTAAASVTATFTLKTFALTVNKIGTGTGTVTSSPSGIDCGADCSETYTVGQSVILTAVPTSGTTFDGWSGGGCSGTSTCTVTLSAATTVTATFTRIVRSLTINKTGNGFGSVSSTPAGIVCGGSCTASFPIDSQVTLTASPNVGTNFTGWSGGGCSGTGDCVVTMSANTTVTANFVLQSLALHVNKAGTGAATGTVVSTPVGINCGSDCDENFNFGSAIALNASTSPGTDFNGWSGAGCSGTGTCVVTMSQAWNVTATFTTQTFALSVTKSGNGNGSVTSEPAGITCGADCAEVYNIGTVVTLTATPQTGTNFVGWSGGVCSGTGTCVVTMDQAKTVNAVFTLQIYTMSVAKVGNGVGTVTSSPSGINCGADCDEPFNYGNTVTLTATPNPSSLFTGWSGAGCSGTGTCVVTMTQAENVTATFTLKTFTLNVDKTGNGTGTISSSPSGVNCGADCTEVYNIGTVVTLSATPGSGSSFAGWSGACTGNGQCQITVNADTAVTAAFNTFPTVQFSAAAYGGNESRTASITIARTGDLTIASAVTLSTSPGTASGAADCASFGADYVEISQPVNFAPSEAVQSVPITLCPDKNIDPSETINVLLSAPVNANLGSQNPATVSINDTANQYLAGQDGLFLFSNTNAEPYPSMINAIDAPTGSKRVRVTLYDVWHSHPGNLRALLVSPTGTQYVLMAAAGGATPVPSNSPVTITFADFESQILPPGGPILTGSYKPTTCMTPVPNFPSSAPAGPYAEPGCDLLAGPILSTSFGGDQNGGWKLFLMDAGTGVPFTLAGAVMGGWGLELVPSNAPVVEVTGRVLTPGRLGLRNAVVSLTDSQGLRRSVSTSSLGFFTFENVEAGRTYFMSVASRRYRFEARILQFANSVQDLEFVGLE